MKWFLGYTNQAPRYVIMLEDTLLSSKSLFQSLLIACAILPILYIAAPVARLLSGTSLMSVHHILVDPDFQNSIYVSLESALTSTLLSLLFGLPTAFILATRRVPMSRILEGILLLPVLLPPIVGGIAQFNLYGPYTPIGRLFSIANIGLTNHFLGIVLAQTYITSPFLIFAAKAGFSEIPKQLWDVTRELGGGIWDEFWYVSLPLAKTAIFVGALLTFTRAIGEFGATMIMAYHPYTLPVDLWVQFSSGGLDQILAMSFVVIVVVFVVIFIASVVQGLLRERTE